MKQMTTFRESETQRHRHRSSSVLIKSKIVKGNVSSSSKICTSKVRSRSPHLSLPGFPAAGQPQPLIHPISRLLCVPSVHLKSHRNGRLHQDHKTKTPLIPFPPPEVRIILASECGYHRTTIREKQTRNQNERRKRSQELDPENARPRSE